MKLRFLLGAGIGYVLGTRAGREQYERLTSTVRDLADSDTVRNLREQVPGLGGGASSSSRSQASTPPLTAGPGPQAGTDATATPGDDVGIAAGGDPAAGGDVVLPDLESSTSRSRAPRTSRAPKASKPDTTPATPADPPGQV